MCALFEQINITPKKNWIQLVVCTQDGIRPCLKPNKLLFKFVKMIKIESFKNSKNQPQDKTEGSIKKNKTKLKLELKVSFLIKN
jgi:hypothetical protein